MGFERCCVYALYRDKFMVVEAAHAVFSAENAATLDYGYKLTSPIMPAIPGRSSLEM